VLVEGGRRVLVLVVVLVLVLVLALMLAGAQFDLIMQFILQLLQQPGLWRHLLQPVGLNRFQPSSSSVRGMSLPKAAFITLASSRLAALVSAVAFASASAWVSAVAFAHASDSAFAFASASALALMCENMWSDDVKGG
jgi:hypothetical protein